MTTIFNDTLTTQDILALIALASKACLLVEEIDYSTDRYKPVAEIETLQQPMARAQFFAAATEVRPLLAKLDEEIPGLIPIPHDGTPWRLRDKKQ